MTSVHQSKFNVISIGHPLPNLVTKIHVLCSTRECNVIEHLQRTLKNPTRYIKECTFDGHNRSTIISPRLTPFTKSIDNIKPCHIKDLIKHLREIHEADVLHNDITIDNIMYDPIKDELNIIDFGSSHILKNIKPPFKAVISPSHYRCKAPEALDRWDKDKDIPSILSESLHRTREDIVSSILECPLAYTSHTTFMVDVFALGVVILNHTPSAYHPTSLQSMLSLDVNTRTY